MNAVLWAVALAAGFGGAHLAQAATDVAEAVLRNASGDKVGHVTLVETGQGIRISVRASGLAPGFRGFHIHEVGRCDPPGFASAGGHFNPDGKKHGTKNPEGPHAGDLPNLQVAADGTVSVDVVVRGITLGRNGHSLFHPPGTALVIHADADDKRTDPAGNAGARIACGVIKARDGSRADTP